MDKRLVELVRYAYEHVELYRCLYDEARVNVYEDFSMEDLPIIK